MKKSVKWKTALVLWGATDLGPPHFSGDLLWRTGFKAPSPFFLVDILEDGVLDFNKSYLLTNPLELERASKEAKADEVVNLDDYKSKTRSALVNFLKKHGVEKVVVPDTFPCELCNALLKSFKVAYAKPPFYPGRAIKTDWEIGEIEKAQRAVENAVRKAIDYLKTCSTTTNNEIIHGLLLKKLLYSKDLRKIIDDELYKQGYLGVDTIVSCGAQAADPHCAGSGPLKAHQPIVMDVFPLSLETHYYADMTRTIFRGEPSKELRDMYQEVLFAQEMAMHNIKAGVDGHDIYEAVLVQLESALYPTDLKNRPMEGFIHGVGHGVGIDMHEPPWIGSTKCILQEGNVVTVEPGLYYSQARDHIPVGGIRIEDMVLVTKDGCRNLTNFPKDLDSMIIS